MTRTGRLIATTVLAAGFFATALLAPVAAHAADIEVEATVDRNIVSLNGRLILTITVSGTARQISTPKLPDLTEAFVIQSAGSSSNFSMVNGQVTSSKSWNFALFPRSVGTFTIEPAEVEFEGSVYRTEPIAIEVVEGSAPEPARPEERASSGVQSGGRDVFITTSVDKKRAYVDEQVTLSFKFYRRINLYQQPQYTPPELTGFWSEDLPPQEEYYETVGGVRYHVIELRTALFGTAPGDATIGPAKLTYQEGGGFGFFATPGRERALTTDPIKIQIMPLPAAGRPDGFAGAVGSYRIRATLTPGTLPALQPATLRITISGTGNLRKLTAPGLPELPDFKVYESSTSSDVTHENRLVGGTKTYEYVLVPQSPGAKTIPAIRLAHFAPGSGEYRVADTGELQLVVGEAVPGAEEAAPPTAGIARLGTDIRYIREPGGPLAAAPEPIYVRPWFLVLQLVPLLALAGLWAGRRRQDALASDQGLARYVRASARARAALREARAAGSDRGAACAAVAKAVTGFIGDRLGVAARGMTLQEIEADLRSAGANDSLVSRVRALLADCDLGRFAAGAEEVEIARILGEAEECLTAVARLSRRRRR